jgi:hypothetical protein
MRNWPYAYSIAADPKQSKVVGKFSVTTPPGSPAATPGTVGGCRRQQVLEAPGRGDRVRPLHDEPGGRGSTRSPIRTFHDPGGGQGSGCVKANPYLKPQIATVARVTRPARWPGTTNEGQDT